MKVASRLCYRSNGSLSIVFAITDPSETKFITFDENFANGLQRVLLVLCLQEQIVAPAKCP
jgi:hypothetical protein